MNQECKNALKGVETVFDKFQGESVELEHKIKHLEDVITFYQRHFGAWNIGHPTVEVEYEVLTYKSHTPFRATFYPDLCRWIADTTLENGQTINSQVHPVAWRPIMAKFKEKR